MSEGRQLEDEMRSIIFGAMLLLLYGLVWESD